MRARACARESVRESVCACVCAWIKLNLLVRMSDDNGCGCSFVSVNVYKQEGSPFDFGQFLDTFYLSRVGMRVLIGQHIMLHHPQDGFIGIIQTACKPAFVCEHAILDAQQICEMSLGLAPNVKVCHTNE